MKTYKEIWKTRNVSRLRFRAFEGWDLIAQHCWHKAKIIVGGCMNNWILLAWLQSLLLRFTALWSGGWDIIISFCRQTLLSMWKWRLIRTICVLHSWWCILITAQFIQKKNVRCEMLELQEVQIYSCIRIQFWFGEKIFRQVQNEKLGKHLMFTPKNKKAGASFQSYNKNYPPSHPSPKPKWIFTSLWISMSTEIFSKNRTTK